MYKKHSNIKHRPAQTRFDQLSNLRALVEREQRLIASYLPAERRQLLEQLNLRIYAEGGKWGFDPVAAAS